jgi:hypothetical protein
MQKMKIFFMQWKMEFFFANSSTAFKKDPLISELSIPKRT